MKQKIAIYNIAEGPKKDRPLTESYEKPKMFLPATNEISEWLRLRKYQASRLPIAFNLDRPVKRNGDDRKCYVVAFIDKASSVVLKLLPGYYFCRPNIDECEKYPKRLEQRKTSP